MRIGMMQPYFFPYIGYFQLIASVDLMLLVDDFSFRKGTFMTRNRILENGTPSWIILPVVKSSTNRSIAQHHVSLDPDARKKLIRRVHHAYVKSVSVREGISLFESALSTPAENLASMLTQGVAACCNALHIATAVKAVTSAEIAPGTAGVDRVLAICEHFGAKEYVNLPGGRALYPASRFAERGIRLGFIEPNFLPYEQPGTKPFYPGLSVLDLLMNAAPESRHNFTSQYRIDWCDT